MAQQYNPRRKQQPAPAKKKRPSGASPTTRGKSRQPVPGWIWLAAGIAVGVFVSLLVKLSSVPPSGNRPVAMPGEKAIEKEKVAQAVKAEREKAARERAADKAEKKTPDDAKPATRFDFYTLLPEREVIVPDREAMQQKNGTGTAAQQPAANESLFLQAGSFRSPQEADRRRAQILLLGLDARVESVVANGDTWYRVHAGPFTSREKLTKAREQLSAEGIETLLLKQKPTG